MDVTEQIKRYHDFIEKQYLDALYENVRKGENKIIISFLKLIEFDPELANELLERPEECISAAEFAVREFDLPAEVKNFRIRFNELSESQKMMIRNIRSKHLTKLFHIEGIVRQKSDVRPQVTSAKFECPSCGNIISVLQLESKFKEPSRCGCGRKGKFRLLSKELIDAQHLVLEEAPEDLDGGEQPKRIGVILKEDLVSPMSDKKTNPGNKVMVTGIVKEVAKTGKDGSKLITFDLIVEANYIEPSQEDYYQMEISEEDEEKIKKIAYDPRVYTLISESIAPTIFGYERVKEAIALQLVGGVKKSRKDGTVTRGDMHVLLIGDPGSGKCVIGNTKIILDSGEITTIQEFYDNNSANISLQDKLKVFSIDADGLNFASNAVRLWRRKAPETVLKILTSTGNEIVVTDEHPLFTTKNGLIFGKNAIEFKAGEYIALPSKIDVNGSLQKIPLEIKHTPAHNKARYKIKEVFDEEFARLFGYLVGDGYVRMRKTSGVISFTNKNQELLADFEKLIEKCFCRKVSKRRKQDSECYEYYTCSIELVRILQNIDGCITKKSGDMKICKTVALSPNNILREFIRALFECEGSVSKDKREIELSSKSKGLIFDLKYLLLRFGIISQVSPCIKYAANTKNKTRGTYYRLRISGEQVIRFAENIGFISTKKTNKLTAWNKEDKKLNTNIDIIPNLDDLLKTLRHTYSLSQNSFSIKRSTYQHYERGDRWPSYNKLRKIVEKYNKINKDDPLVQILDKIANTDLFWDKIKCIETIKSEGDYVYDIEIDTVHNFIANGVMVHNSQLLKRTSKIAPKARYVSGKGVSGAGLTASVVKDEFLGGWSLEAGALPLANKGFCVAGETEIYLANGNLKKIDEIYNRFNAKKNDAESEVYYLNPKTYKFEKAKIVNVSKRIVDTTFKIETDTGQTIIATEEHPFAVWNNGLEWKEVKHLKEKDRLFAPNPANKTQEYDELKKILDNKIIFPRIKKITRLSSKREVYNLQLDKKEAPNFIANFLLVHNCLIDEMDKMSEEDTAAMHEALEGQTITISKANIQATLRAETTVLAAANPKLGRFDPYDILAKQIAMPPALINRFDLIFAFKDLPNTEKDERMASHILKLHQSPDVAEPEITTEILRKFISYARQNCHPVLSSEAIEELKTYYVQMRNSTNSEEAGMKAVPISARQLEALVRLAEATAKLRLGKEVTREDAKRAVDILHFSLSEIGIDPETGKIDIDRIASGITASQRTKIHKIKDIILELENKFGKNVPIQDIIEEAKLQGLTEDQVEEALEKLKRSGDLFEPTKGYVASI